MSRLATRLKLKRRLTGAQALDGQTAKPATPNGAIACNGASIGFNGKFITFSRAS